ncbi:MAG: hypothetical protein C0506_13670, partial [Anaerolinea sp.]|nr:hypothetical protein [Anaerolinea sp.]
MTLAYYGKSRQRQALLAIVTFFAIAIGAVAAGLAIKNADAVDQSTQGIAPVLFEGDASSAGGVVAACAPYDNAFSTGTNPGVGPTTINLGGGASVVVTEDTGQTYVAFVANIPILRVYIKGGSNANSYTYPPTYPSGVLSDGNLHAPLNPSGAPAGVSHIVFCWNNTDPNRQITVTKVRLGNGPAAETFGGSITGAGAVDTSWSIPTASGNNHTSQNRTVAKNAVATINETLTGAQTTAGWQLTGFTQVSGLNATCPSVYQGVLDNTVPADTASYTYCVYNQYTQPQVITPGVTKVDSGDGTYDLGESFYWTLTFNLAQGETTQSFTFTDPLPGAVNFVSLTNEVDPDSKLSCSELSGTVTCTLATGAGSTSGASVYSIRVNVTVKTNATCGPVTNNVLDAVGATVASDGVTIAGCGTTVTKTAPLNNYTPGDQFTWTITWTVTGGATTAAQVYSDILPPDFEFQTPLALGNQVDPSGSLGCSAGTNNVDCTLQAGATAGTYSQEVFVKVKSTATCGPVTNFVKSGPSTNQGSAVASDEVTIYCGTTAVTKTAPLNSYTLGDQFTWTITWTVSGGSTNAAQLYSDILPADFEFQTPLAIGNQVDPSGSLGCSAGTNNVDCTLQAGATA